MREQRSTRRTFIGLATASALTAFGKVDPRIGVQLYTVRDLVNAEPLNTLRAIRQMGYGCVEMLRSQVKPLMPVLNQVGLQAVSLHFETPLITGNWSAWRHADMPPIEKGVTYESCVSLARDNNFRYIVFNYLSPEERLGLDFYRSLADKLNEAARKAREAGLQFCYHNHDFEFEPKGSSRPIDVILKSLDPNLVRLEVDAFWISMAGVNAAAFLREHAARIEMVHLKDRAPGTPVHYDIATVPNDTFRELGGGDLPLPQILQAIRDTQCRFVFVEQDFSPDPLKSLRESRAYLQGRHFGE